MSTMLATQMASKKAEGMLAPLLSDEESSIDSDDSNASSKMETVKKGPLQKLKTFLVYIGVSVGCVASVGAMVLSPAIAIFVMGGICIANAPYALFKERQMDKIPSLRAMNNKLREDANNLEDAVDDLSEEIDLLEPEADRAASVEEELRGIAEKQEVNVNKLVELVKENEIILAKMRDNLRQRIVQDIITIVVKSDRDNDQTIDKSEAKTLALRIRLSLQEYGVQFDSDKFLKAIGSNPSVPGVIAIVQKLLPKAESAVDDGSSVGSGTDDEYDSEDDDDDDDIYDMFYMADDDVRASCASGDGGDAMDPSRSTGLSLMTCDKKKSSRRSSVKGRSGRR